MSVCTGPARSTSAGALELAQQLSRLPAVEVAGISCYPGHAREDPNTIGPVVEAVDALLRETRDAFTTPGIRCDRISGGSTPTRYLTHTTCVNELRAGTYALLDRVDAPAEPSLGLDACALSVAVTVVSDSVPGQIVIDAGSKTFTSDEHPDGGHGVIVGWPDAGCTRSTRSTATSTCRGWTSVHCSVTVCRSSRTTRAAA